MRWKEQTRDSIGALAESVRARYVRVEITRTGTDRVGIRELEVVRAP